MSSTTKYITIDLMVDEDIGKVLFAEVDSDFMDILFSFFTIRLATLHVVHDMQSSFGCIGRLYQSVVDLSKHSNYDGLIFPYRSLDFENCSETSIVKYYCLCRIFYNTPSAIRNSCCKCGIRSKMKIKSYQPKNNDGEELLFLKKGGKFVITDDFIAKPITSESSTCSLLSSIGIRLGNNLKLKRVTIAQNQVLDLFKRCLVSTTPFSDVFLSNVPQKDDKVPHIGNLIKSRNVEIFRERTSQLTSSSINDQKFITVKLLFDKLKNRLLFAEAKNDFFDLLREFLYGSLEQITPEFSGRSPLHCLFNLYQSASELEVDIYKSEKHKSTFYGNSPSYLNRLIESITDGTYISLINGKRLFIVTDDLQVTPYSLASSLSMLQKFNMTMEGIEERVVSVGEEEARKLLMGLLTSDMTLTGAFLM